MVVSSREKQTPIRIPTEIKEWIREEAAVNGRSMNTEVVFILKKAMEDKKCEKH